MQGVEEGQRSGIGEQVQMSKCRGLRRGSAAALVIKCRGFRWGSAAALVSECMGLRRGRGRQW